MRWILAATLAGVTANGIGAGSQSGPPPDRRRAAPPQDGAKPEVFPWSAVGPAAYARERSEQLYELAGQSPLGHGQLAEVSRCLTELYALIDEGKLHDEDALAWLGATSGSRATNYGLLYRDLLLGCLMLVVEAPGGPPSGEKSDPFWLFDQVGAELGDPLGRKQSAARLLVVELTARGQHELVLPLLGHALELDDDPAWRASYRQQEARAAARRGDDHAVLEAIERAREENRAAGAGPRGRGARLAAALDLMEARVWLQLGRLSDVEECLLRAEAQAARVVEGGVAAQARAEVELGWVTWHLARNDASAAEAAAARLQAEAQAPGVVEALRAWLFTARGVSLAQLARVDAGLAGRAREVLLEAAEGGEPLAAARSRLQLAEIALDAGRIEEALGHLGRLGPGLDREEDLHGLALRALCALDAGAPRAELAPLRDRLEAEVSALWSRWGRASEATSEGIGFLLRGSRRQALGALVELDLALEGGEDGARRALERLLEVQRFGRLTRERAGGLDVGLEPLRDLLGARRSGALVLLPTPRRTHALLLDGEGTSYVALPRGDRLRDGSAAVHSALERLLADPEDEGRKRSAAGAAEALAGLALPPEIVDRFADWDGLVLVGADMAGELPLEALPLPRGAEDEPRALVGEELAIQRCESLPLYAALARAPGPEAASRAGELVLLADLGDPDAEPGSKAAARWLAQPEAFALSDAELSRWIGGWATEDVRIVPPAELDERYLREQGARLVDAKVVHVLVHGVRLRRAVNAAALWVDGGDGAVTAEELREWVRVSGTVLLSVCGAAEGDGLWGEDDGGDLGGAFLSCGARAVVLSRARLPYAFTQRWMGAVQQRLAQGVPPAAALRDVRRGLRERGRGLAVRMQGAQFLCVGDGSR